MASRALWRDPAQLARARVEAQLLLQRSIEAQRRHDPFCPARLRLTRLLRFRTGQDVARTEQLLAQAIEEELPTAQAAICDLLQTLIHDLGDAA
jgi:hypothetical protein